MRVVCSLVVGTAVALVSMGGCSSAPHGTAGIADGGGAAVTGSGDTAASANGGSAAEAEAVPPNGLSNGANVTTCPNTTQYKKGLTCAPEALTEGAYCCSAGKLVVNLLGRLDGGLTFNGVTVPSDGTYDVTWWYHCGANDTYQDYHCGGLYYPVGTGCRPHMIVVNGVLQTAGAKAEYYQFPCYSGDWSIFTRP